jgi:hypothetical protein
VIVNFGEASENATVHFDGIGGEVTIAAPDQPDRKADLPLDLTIPPHRLLVVVRK